MITKYKWIEFDEIPNPDKKTRKWDCINTSGEHLGDVLWHTGFRQYSFEPDLNPTVFSAGCLRDIAEF